MEQAIIDSGPCGPFQVVHVLFTQATRFVLAWSINFMMFGNFNPGWHCLTTENVNNSIFNNNNSSGMYTATTSFDSTEEKNNHHNFSSNTSLLLSISTTTPEYVYVDSSVYSNSSIQFNKDVSGLQSFHINNTNPNNTNTAVDVLQMKPQMTDGLYNQTCKTASRCSAVRFKPGSSTIVTEFGLICERSWIVSFILFMQFVGMITGSLFWGQLGEKYGRRVSVYGSTALLAVCNISAVFSTCWEMYLVCSVFIGFGAIGILSCVPVYSMEFLSAKWRGLFASLPVWNLSSCAFAGVVFLLKDWQQIHIVIAVVTSIAFLGIFWVPESPRWLAVNGRVEKAVVVIERMFRVNKKTKPNLDTIRQLSLDSDQTYLDDKDNSDYDINSPSKTYTYLDLFRSRDLTLITAKLSILLIIAICTYNTLGFGVYSLPGNFYVNFVISSSSEIPGNILVGFLANQIGRRWSGFAFSVVQTASFVIIVILCIFPSVIDMFTKDLIVKILAFISRGSAVSLLCLISPIAVELLPTVVRSLGLGFILMMSRIGGLIAPFLLPGEEETSFMLCFICLAGMSVVSCVVFLSLPETNKKPLLDSIQVRQHQQTEVANDNSHIQQFVQHQT